MPRTKGAKNRPKLTDDDLEIRSIDKKDSGKSKVVRNNYHKLYVIPNHPSGVMFSGAKKSGKTTLLVNLLTNRNYYAYYFTNIYVFSPNAFVDENWETLRDFYATKTIVFKDDEGEEYEAEVKDDRAVFFEDLDEAESKIKEIMSEQKAIVEDEGIENSPRILIVLDDFIDHPKLTNSKIIMSLFTRGRHNNISTWMCTQAYNAPMLKMRKNLTNIIQFRTANEKEVECLAQECCHRKLTRDEFKRIFDYATKEPFSFLHIYQDLPVHLCEKMYRKKFLEVLEIVKP